jgi:hypothetical protein
MFVIIYPRTIFRAGFVGTYVYGASPQKIAKGWTDTVDGDHVGLPSFREESCIGKSPDSWLKDYTYTFYCQLSCHIRRNYRAY